MENSYNQNIFICVLFDYINPPLFIQGRVSLRAMLSLSHSHQEAVQYKHRLSSSTGAARVKGFAQRHLSGGNAAKKNFPHPVLSCWSGGLNQQALFSNLLANPQQPSCYNT